MEQFRHFSISVVVAMDFKLLYLHLQRVIVRKSPYYKRSGGETVV